MTAVPCGAGLPVRGRQGIVAPHPEVPRGCASGCGRADRLGDGGGRGQTRPFDLRRRPGRVPRRAAGRGHLAGRRGHAVVALPEARPRVDARPAGYERETRAFQPHITCRAKHDAGAGEFRDVDALRRDRVRALSITDVHLFRATSADGARYERIARPRGKCTWGPGAERALDDSSESGCLRRPLCSPPRRGRARPGYRHAIVGVFEDVRGTSRASAARARAGRRGPRPARPTSGSVRRASPSRRPSPEPADYRIAAYRLVHHGAARGAGRRIRPARISTDQLASIDLGEIAESSRTPRRRGDRSAHPRRGPGRPAVDEITAKIRAAAVRRCSASSTRGQPGPRRRDRPAAPDGRPPRTRGDLGVRSLMTSISRMDVAKILVVTMRTDPAHCASLEYEGHGSVWRRAGRGDRNLRGVQARPDLLDVKMVCMDGLEVPARLREHDPTRSSS